MNAPARIDSAVAFALSLALVLAACGGGGDSSPPAPAPVRCRRRLRRTPTCTGSGTFSVVADASVAVGKAAGAVLAGCTGADQQRAVDANRGAGGHVAFGEIAGDQLRAADRRRLQFHGRRSSMRAARTQTASVSVNAVAPSAPARGVGARRSRCAQGRQRVAARVAGVGGRRNQHMDADRRPAGHARYQRSEPRVVRRAGGHARHRAGVSA